MLEEDITPEIVISVPFFASLLAFLMVGYLYVKVFASGMI